MEPSGISLAVGLVGGSPSALARLIGGGVKRQHVEHWLKTGRVPVERCAPLETALGKRVRRWQLRPGDWHRHWPELVGEKGAPKPQAELPLDMSEACDAAA